MVSEPIRPKRALIKDVYISTMYSMREQGMSNRQIANSLDCSIATVYKHIGCTGKRAKRSDETYPKDMPSVRIQIPQHIAKNERGGVKKSKLKIVSKRQEFQGELCKYSVDMINGDIEITDGIVTGLLDKKSLHGFIAELEEIKTMLLPFAVD